MSKPEVLSGKKARWRAKKFAQNSKCFYCQKEMILFEFRENTDYSDIPGNAASIEHLHENGSKERQNGNAEKVLACFHCNQNRSNRLRATTIFTAQFCGLIFSLKRIGNKIGVDKV